ncbi:MAG: hypothetical protein GEU86_15140 [Actinophytocola sp.]|nr:hypothetical protein [Actinophytocola sp.]
MADGRTPRPAPKPAAETKDLSALCDDEPRFYSNTAAYTRTGPSPIVVFEPVGPNFHPVFLTETELTKAKPEIWQPDKARPQDVQLVACVSKPDEGEKVGSCTFTSNTFDLHRGEYEVTVYEARTGKEVAELEVRGKDSGGCP